MPHLPEANDQQASLEELGPEFAEWLDEIESEVLPQDFVSHEERDWRLEGDYLRAMAVDENGEV